MRATGWILFVAALGMMFTLLSVDVASLNNWKDATTPSFVGSIFAHFGAVIAAFVGGKLIPNDEPPAPPSVKVNITNTGDGKP